MPRHSQTAVAPGMSVSPLDALVKQTVTWKRRWFKQVSYDTVEQLVDDCPSNPDARAFVGYALQLRDSKVYRKTLSDLLSVRRVGVVKERWHVTFMRSLWMLYKTERNLCRRSFEPEDFSMRSLTQKQRQVLAGSGKVRVRRTSAVKMASKNRSDTIRACGAFGAVLWIDNFNKYRFARNVNEERDKCINGTVMAMMPLPADFGRSWVQWPALNEVMMQIPSAVAFIVKSQIAMINEVKTLQQHPYSWQMIRVPCDLRRVGVRNLP